MTGDHDHHYDNLGAAIKCGCVVVGPSPVEKKEETPSHCEFEGCACKIIAHPSVPCPRTTPLNTSWEDSFDETDFGFVMNANPKRNLKDFIRSLLASETTKARQQAREAFAEETIEFIKLKLDAKD